MNKEKRQTIIMIILILVFGWLWITTIIYWAKNTDKTCIEVFLHIPKSFVLDITEIEDESLFWIIEGPDTIITVNSSDIIKGDSIELIPAPGEPIPVMP